MRTRYIHQVTAAALYVLMKEAFDDFISENSPLDNEQGRQCLTFAEWAHQRASKYPQFDFWLKAME